MKTDIISNKSAVVIGGGPAGLMAAEILIKSGVNVDLYDAMPSPGLKFLRAAKGGLNLTHSEPIEKFLSRYGKRRQQIEPFITSFGPENLREWVRGLGVETFIGSSGRVFPSDMKAAPILRNWLKRLENDGVNFHMRHSWCGWDCNGNLKFKTKNETVSVKADAVVMALGGGSWKHLGSDGSWVSLFEQYGVPVSPLRPSNCGFETKWSEYFKNRFQGQSLKPVTIIQQDGISAKQGEITITSKGIEGGLIYSMSAYLRDIIEKEGSVVINIDLSPGRSIENIVSKLSRPRGSSSISNHLRKQAGIEGVKAGLLREIISKNDFNDPELLAKAIKNLPLRLIATSPLDEAISTAGGIPFDALDRNLMILSMPGVFCAGEMIDWEAPTGGYLLTACFSTGHAAGIGAQKWLSNVI